MPKLPPHPHAATGTLISPEPPLLKLPGIQQFSRVVAYEKREAIFREGMPSDCIYILLKGTAMSYRTARNGQQVLFGFIKPGMLYGYMTAFGDFTHTMSVEALEVCSNLEIDKVHLKEALLQHPAMMWKFAEDMARGIRDASQRVENSFLPAEQRVYKCLYNLCEQFGHETGEGIELRLGLTQENFAWYAGTTRATAARLLSHLSEQGFLRVTPKPWVILRKDCLLSYLVQGWASQKRRDDD